MARVKKPEWLKIKIGTSLESSKVSSVIKKHCLHTICTSGKCPNLSECWGRRTASFMILGNICTRACRFCNTNTGKPLPPNSEEPNAIAESIKLMQLKHAVVTSVTRDDLPDYGATHWAETIRSVKEVNPNTTIEVLIPDFNGNSVLINTIIAQKPDIISHNIETVERLTPLIRSVAKYKTSLEVVSTISKSGITAKSGFMVGLGETDEEIYSTMDDLLANGCSVLTIGQYLQPTRNHIEVAEYIHPEKFRDLKTIALQKGFRIVESGPLVRSSYHAEGHI